VQVYTAGENDKIYYIAMEFVEGETLRAHIESQGRLDPREAVAITVLVAQALQYAWNKARIIHRDIKPENIFLSNAGEVKVGDLGLAKTVGGGSTSLTQTGMMMGSPHYISPEQARGLSDIDFRTDIYSLGCTLYHMLTGRPPYTGTDPLVVINKHVNEPPPAIFKVWPTCPIPLALLVGKMLAKQRHERPASYDDLIEQLHEVHGKLKPATAVAPASASEPTPAPAPPKPKPTVAKTPKPAPKARDAKSVTRDPRIVIGAGAIALLVLLAGLFIWAPWKPPSTTPVDATALEPGAIRLWDSPDKIPKQLGVRWENSAVVFSADYKNALKWKSPLSRDAIIRADIRMNQDAGIQCIGLRHVGVPLSGKIRGDNCYRIELKADRAALMSVHASSGSRLHVWPLPRAYGTDEWIRLELRAIGDKLTISIDGQALGTVHDSSLPEPGGVLVHGSNGSFRNIVYVPLDKKTEGVASQTQSATTASALKQLGNVFTNAVGAEMVYVPPGEFMMGSTPEEQAWAVANGAPEKAVKREGEASRKATMKQGFWMGRTEVTVGQWKQFVKETGYATDGEKNGESCVYQGRRKPAARMKGKNWRDPNFGFEPQDNHPVCCVSWNDARAFCEWLMEQERKAGRLARGYAVRLPTEAEWEYACRAGTQAKFWWGDTQEDGQGRLNRTGEADGFEFVSPVDHYGARGRNRFGLADMLGNVWEWCLDETGNPNDRELRGGSFGDLAVFVRCADRRAMRMTESDSRFGFRICLGPDVLGSAAAAGSNAPPVITNWRDVMPLVRADMDKKRAARQEDGWVVATQDPRGAANICYQPLGDIAIRGRFRNECLLHLTVSGVPSKYYSASLSRGGGSFGRNHYEGSEGNHTLKVQPLASFQYSPANEHDFVVTKVGDLLSACVDGALVGSARDATFTSGMARLYLQHTGDAIRDLAIADLSAAASATADAAWQNAINLLPLIDPQKDAVKGPWTLANGELISSSAYSARLEMPYRPPEEYDFRIVFSRRKGERDIHQMFPSEGRAFLWGMSMGNDKKCGFLEFQPDAVRRLTWLDGSLANGQRYTSVVEVRKERFRAYLDGKLITEWKIAPSNPKGIVSAVSVTPRDPTLLGVGSYGSDVVFHRIEVREVTGKGTFTRGAPAVASNTPALQHSTPSPAALSAFCAEVAALPREEQVKRVAAKLKELNPQFDGQIKTSLLGDPGWAGIAFSARGIRDISPVRALAWLKEFICSAEKNSRSEFSDLSPLRGLQLRKVDCGWTRVADLSPLRGMPLRTVTLHNCPVSDFTPLEGCPIEQLQIPATGLRELTQLRTFRLKNLNINQNPISDLSPLRGMPLTTLNLQRTKARDLAPLQGMPLTWLICASTDVTDLSPLRDAPLQTFAADAAVITRPANAVLLRSMKTLERINNLSAVEFWKQVDAGKVPGASADDVAETDDAFIREVAALPAEQQVARVVAKLKELNPGYDGQETHRIADGKVEELLISAGGVTDISPVRALAGLKKFLCDGTYQQVGSLSDLSPLRGLKLHYCFLAFTQVSDLSPLQGMPLVDVNCKGTRVRDLSPLKGAALTALDCSLTQVTDLLPLNGMPLTRLYCDFDPTRDANVLRSIKTLKTINKLPVAELWKQVDAGKAPSVAASDAFLREVSALPAEQ
ncbi:MAG: SUMF1/EgtB/PvdO family nonheme iron enzyme, partial [Verrucomicrobia bacterium]|nr:SUMF1/EgtB/PvdO family nonheme iron enzyme [Verrucomicrobiota bacterium]